MQFLGIYWLANGLFNMVSIFIDRVMWGWKLLAGVFTPKDLLARGAFPKGRDEIAERTGISCKLLLKWVNQCDLFRNN